MAVRTREWLLVIRIMIVKARCLVSWPYNGRLLRFASDRIVGFIDDLHGGKRILSYLRAVYLFTNDVEVNVNLTIDPV